MGGTFLCAPSSKVSPEHWGGNTYPKTALLSSVVVEPMIFCFHRKTKRNLGFKTEFPVSTST